MGSVRSLSGLWAGSLRRDIGAARSHRRAKFISGPRRRENRCRRAVVMGANFWAVQGSVLHPVLVKPLLERVLPWSLLMLATLSVPWMVWSPTGLSRLEA